MTQALGDYGLWPKVAAVKIFQAKSRERELLVKLSYAYIKKIKRN